MTPGEAALLDLRRAAYAETAGSVALRQAQRDMPRLTSECFAAERALARTIVCPTCKAAVGDRCDWGGLDMLPEHGRRLSQATTAATEQGHL